MTPLRRMIGFYSAFLLSEPGDWLDAYICPVDDSDFFRFYVIAGEQINAELNNTSGSYDLEMYDPNQAKRGSHYGSASTGRYVSLTADVTGYWYARVRESNAGEWFEAL